MVYERDINKRYTRLCRAILDKALYDAGDPKYFYANDEKEFLLFLDSSLLEIICELGHINKDRFKDLLAKRLEKGLGGVKVKRVKFTMLKGVLHEGSRSIPD